MLRKVPDEIWSVHLNHIQSCQILVFYQHLLSEHDSLAGACTRVKYSDFDESEAKFGWKLIRRSEGATTSLPHWPRFLKAHSTFAKTRHSIASINNAMLYLSISRRAHTNNNRTLNCPSHTHHHQRSFCNFTLGQYLVVLPVLASSTSNPLSCLASEKQKG